MKRVLGLALVLVAGGWGYREVVHFQGEGLIKSGVVNRDEVALKEFVFGGVRRGSNGAYFKGETANLRKFDTGRFVLLPGKEPHPAHQHPEEELLVVISGKGVFTCEGVAKEVGPGSVMYAAPGVMHGGKNTGEEPMEVLLVKWLGREGEK